MRRDGGVEGWRGRSGDGGKREEEPHQTVVVVVVVVMMSSTFCPRGDSSVS